MALIKKVDFKGIEAKYRVILRNEYNKLSNTSSGVVGLYVDKKTKNLDEAKNVLRTLDYRFIGELLRKDVYAKLSESIPVTQLVSHYIPAVIDEETGEIITPEVKEVYENKETNELAGAENDV